MANPHALFHCGSRAVVRRPAYSALFPTLVGPEDISNAIAMNSIQFNIARILGPVIGGVAYTALGATWCFGLNGLSYIAVIVSLFAIHVKFVPSKSTESVLFSMKEGIRFIRRRDGMSALVVSGIFDNFIWFLLSAFLPVFVRSVFHKGPETYTLLLVCSGAGSICGALAVATMERLKRQARLALLILVALGLLIAGFAVSRWLPLSCVLNVFRWRGGYGFRILHAFARTTANHDAMRGE